MTGSPTALGLKFLTFPAPITGSLSIATFFRDGKPVNPEEAIAVFGAPDFDIRGPAATVETNRGTAGDLVKTGTAADTTW